jgi:hypothetical protein
MKKRMPLLIAVSILFALFAGCTDQESRSSAPAPSLPSASETFSSPPAGSSTPPVAEHGLDTHTAEPEQPSKTADQEDDGVDVDLTALSSTMVYGEVYNMMMEPERYIGQTIKMRGLYYSNFYESTGQHYHFVIVQDATACCAQGLEFVWIGEHVYPDDYPENESEIEIAGVWEGYEEEGHTWYRIKTDAISVL